MTFKIFNKARTHYIEVNPRLGLCYVCECKGNKLLEIVSVKEMRAYLENLP